MLRRGERWYLTTEQVAAALAVTPKTVRTWIARGELPARKLHRRWRIDVEDLALVLGDNPDAS